MRVLLFVSAFAVSSVAPAVAFACGPEDGVQRPTVSAPVAVQPNVSALLARAQRLERVANSVEEQARHAERRAAEFSAQASEFRQVAFDLDGVERSNLLITAGELGLRAKEEKRRAQRAHNQARNLRAQAQLLFDRAAQLNSGMQPMHRGRTRPVI
jgi:hypothetical protein